MQVTREMQKLARKSGEIRNRIRLIAQRTANKGLIAYDRMWMLFGEGAERHRTNVRQRAERLAESWDFGYWHGLFMAEDGYQPGQERPEGMQPHCYAEAMDKVLVSPVDSLDYPTTPITVPFPTAEERAKQAEIDGFPGKAARLRGASEVEARKVEAPAEKQARRNKAKIDHEFASGKRTSLI